MSKEIIDVEVINERESQEYTVKDVVSVINTNSGVITFPKLVEWQHQLEQDFRNRGYDRDDIELEDRSQYTALKKERAELNALKNTFEEERKQAQREATQIHKDFLTQSKETVHKAIDDALVNIGKAISTFEKGLISEGQDFARTYWDKLMQTSPYESMWRYLGGKEGDSEEDNRQFDDMVLTTVLGVLDTVGINTTKKEITNKITEGKDKIESELGFIQTQPYPERVLEEYKRNGRNVFDAINKINAEEERIKKIAEERARELVIEQTKRAEEEQALQAAQNAVAGQITQEVQTPVETINTPPPVPTSVVGNVTEADPVVTHTFTVKGRKSAINHYLYEMQTSGGLIVEVAQKVEEKGLFY